MTTHREIVEAFLCAPRSLRSAEQLLSYVRERYSRASDNEISQAKAEAAYLLEQTKANREAQTELGREQATRELAQLENDIWLLSRWRLAEGKAVYVPEQMMDDDVPF